MAAPIGRHPFWRPRTAGDKALVAIFTALYVAAFAPMRVATRLLGWTKLDWVALDLLSLPGKALQVGSMPFGKRAAAWGRKANALEHTHFVCRLCPAARQAQRDPTGRGTCAWNVRWNQGDFDVPPDFGPRNYVLQFVGRTDLSALRDRLAVREAPPAQPQPMRLRPATLWALSGLLWGGLLAALLAWRLL